MRKRTTVASRRAGVRVSIVTLDGHLGSAAGRAFDSLADDQPGLNCTMHVAGEWAASPDALERCVDDIAKADIVIVCMLFMEDHIDAVLPALKARRETCDAMLCFMCAGEVMQLTRIGSFEMNSKQKGPLALLKKLRGGRSKKTTSSGARQIAMLRRLPRILKFIPGTAQDVRVYFLAMQYWLAGSEENIRNLIAMMVSRYARAGVSAELDVAAPVEYPEVGTYHPRLTGRVSDSREAVEALGQKGQPAVGILLMRSYILAGNTAHYDALIAAIEAQGMNAIPMYASGLDARPAVERFCQADGVGTIDALVSLTGFSLVGGPAYNDANAAAEMLAALDVPCFSAHATEFQSLEAWERSDSGLLPVETTMMVAIPELDGAVAPTLFGGRSETGDGEAARELAPQPERIESLAARIGRLVRLRRAERADRKIGIVLFNFPPNGGSVGTAAYLSVFRSLFNTLQALADAGYTVELPADAGALRDAVLRGNASDYGSDANVHDRIALDDHIRREVWLDEIENEWGPGSGQAPDGRGIDPRTGPPVR